MPDLGLPHFPRPAPAHTAPPDPRCRRIWCTAESMVGAPRQVSTALAGAHEAQRIEAESQLAADLIICNGVSMYFPSAAYLLSAINNSLDAVRCPMTIAPQPFQS